VTATAARDGGGGGGGGGTIDAMITFELKKMLVTASPGESPTWSFLEPLRPALSLPFMVATTNKAATAKHTTIILMGVAKVMAEIRYAEATEKSCDDVWNLVKYTINCVKKDMKNYIFSCNARLQLTHLVTIMDLDTN
jgi:hypothetical protein